MSDFRTFSADRLSEEVPGSPQAVALAALNRLDGLDAARLLPGHGEPYAGSPHAAAQQGRQAGLR